MYVTLIRTVILFVSIMLAVRVMGRRTIGEMQAGELVTTLLISDLAAVPMQEIGIPLLSGIVPIFTLVIIEISMSCLMLRFMPLSRLINGRPKVVVSGGVPDRAALRQLRMTNEDLFEALRKEGVFDISTVRFAIVETDGQLSVLLRSADSPASAKDAGLSVPPEQVRTLVISDGSVCSQALSLIGWDEARLNELLRQRGEQARDIYMMTACADGDANIIRKDAGQ